MGRLLKILRMPVSVFALIAASAVPALAQTVFVNGNTSFTVTWSGSVGGGATLLATAKFTVSNFSSTSFVMTVTNVANTMPISPDIQARLTAFGFGLTPDANFGSLVNGSVYQWAFTNFPGFQKVDVCLTSGGGCAGGASGGLNQGQATSEPYSITITGQFANGVTITPIPAKFQTSLGSLETNAVVVDPPPGGPSDLTIAKVHTSIAIPGGTVTYTVTVTNVGASPSIGTVTVTETPPPGFTVTALSGPGWICTASTCTRSDALAPGASYPGITVTTTVGANATAGTVTNTAVVSGGGEQNTTNNTASDPTVIAVPAPGMDLTIKKSHSANTVVPGQTFTYVVTVLNVGSSPSAGAVTVTETPPPGLTITDLSGAGWTCTVPTRTCTRSDALPSAASYPDITVTASVGPTVAPGTVTNTAVVSGGGDPNSGNNTATDPTTITAPVSGTDLTIAKVHSASSAAPGDIITYTVTVGNVGASPSSGTVTVTETPQAGLTITELSGAGWTCVLATRTCLRADALAPATSYPGITVKASVDPGVAAGRLTNIVIVSGGGDSNTTNNTASDPTTITAPVSGSDLAITKVHSPSSAAPGQIVTYTVTVANVGNSPSSGTVTVTETPPTGLTITAMSGTGWTCTAPTCTRSDALAPGTSYPGITVTTSVGASVAGGTVTNIAVVSGGGDPNAANNTASDPTTITGPAPVSGSDLIIRKFHTPTTAAPGQTVTYNITVANVGTSPSSGTVTVTESAPAGLTITALSGTGWACTVSPPASTCTRSDVLPTATSYPEITVTTIVGATVTAGTVTNVAIVSSGGDPNDANNTANDVTVITGVSGIHMAIAKVTDTSFAAPGQTVRYTVTVANVGNSPSSGTVTVTETPPTGLTVTALSGIGWTCTVQTRTCTRNDVLAPATSYPVITVTTSVGADVTSGTMTNSASVTGGGDPNSGSNTATSPITIGPSPVPVLPVSFRLGLMSALLAIALAALRARRFSLGRKDTHIS